LFFYVVYPLTFHDDTHVICCVTLVTTVDEFDVILSGVDANEIKIFTI
jgi:hypothetical protein